MDRMAGDMGVAAHAEVYVSLHGWPHLLSETMLAQYPVEVWHEACRGDELPTGTPRASIRERLAEKGGGCPLNRRQPQLLALVVEDDPAVAQAIVDALVTGGFRVKVARNGEEACVLPRKSRPAWCF